MFGYNGVPGIAGDNQIPPGILIQGSLQTGVGAGTGVAGNTSYGPLTVVTGQPELDAGDFPLEIFQTGTIGVGQTLPEAFYLLREVDHNAQLITTPVLHIRTSDSGGADSPANEPVLAIRAVLGGNLVDTLNINAIGGLGLFSKTPPTAPRTLAQSVITAITDANAKAAVQACANALSDMGALTLT